MVKVIQICLVKTWLTVTIKHVFSVITKPKYTLFLVSRIDLLHSYTTCLPSLDHISLYKLLYALTSWQDNTSSVSLFLFCLKSQFF